MSSRKLIILDANAIIHRAYHALPPLTSPNGEIVGALYGVCLTLLNVIKTFKPTHIAAAFDRPEKTFRHKEFEAYKAGRKKADEDLVSQIIKAREIFEAFGIPVLEIPGFEADDIIGTLTREAKEIKMESLVVTGDQDTLQLADSFTKIFMLRKGIKDTVIMGPEEIKEKYGFDPVQMIDYKALRGDPSDNIPGVPGIGEKTATQLIQEYGTLEKIYENVDKIPEKVSKKLKAGEKDAWMSFSLATIDREVPIEFNLEKLSWANYDRTKVLDLLKSYGFSSLVSRIPEAEKDYQKTIVAKKQGTLLNQNQNDPGLKRTKNYVLVATKEDVKKLVKEFESSDGFVLDTETDSLGAMTSNLCGVSLSKEEGKAFYVPEKLVSELKELLENPKIQKWGHNLKYDVEVLERHGISVAPLSFDTMVASYILAPGSRAHSLDTLTFTILGHEMIPIEALIGKGGRNQKSMAEVPVEDVAEYSCEDADYTLRLKHHFENELKKEPTLEKVFKEIETPLIPVLIHMEMAGVKLDEKFLKELGSRLGRKIKKLESEIHELAGEPFNINSTQQLGEILFTKLSLSKQGIGRTQKGLSTASEELEKLRDAHEIIPKIQEFRELSKLKNTYLDALPKLINPKTGRVHTSYNQTITATGRLSSSDPNLQNIPIRTELGAELRKAFIAEKGKVLVGVDYSQIELRLAAHIAQDKVMQKLFREGSDVHAETAAFVFKVPLEEVTKEQRRKAKVLNFGVLYGMGPQAFARASGVSYAEAQAFIDEYMRTYRGIAEYMQDAVAAAITQGYVETIYGRRRYLPEIKSGNPQVRAAAERMAINHPIQGSEGDIIKRAMIVIHNKIKEEKMILQVHDELVFEVPKSGAGKFAREIKTTLEGLENLSVPIVVDVKIGENWGEMKGLV